MPKTIIRWEVFANNTRIHVLTDPDAARDVVEHLNKAENIAMGYLDAVAPGARSKVKYSLKVWEEIDEYDLPDPTERSAWPLTIAAEFHNGSNHPTLPKLTGGARYGTYRVWLAKGGKPNPDDIGGCVKVENATPGDLVRLRREAAVVNGTVKFRVLERQPSPWVNPPPLEPAIGMKATISIGIDCYPAKVVGISKSGKTVTVEWIRCDRGWKKQTFRKNKAGLWMNRQYHLELGFAKGEANS